MANGVTVDAVEENDATDAMDKGKSVTGDISIDPATCAAAATCANRATSMQAGGSIATSTNKQDAQSKGKRKMRDSDVLEKLAASF